MSGEDIVPLEFKLQEKDMTGNELKALTGSSPNDWQRLFYDEYKSYVYTIVFNRLRRIANIQDIEECVSDVFTDIFLEPERYAGSEELRGIVGLIAKRRAIDYFRRLADARGIADPLDRLADDSDLEAFVEQRDIARCVMNCIVALGVPDSSIMLMKFFYGMTSPEIAKKLGMKPTAVRKRSQRALVRLRELLAQAGIDGKEW